MFRCLNFQIADINDRQMFESLAVPNAQIFARSHNEAAPWIGATAIGDRLPRAWRNNFLALQTGVHHDLKIRSAKNKRKNN